MRTEFIDEADAPLAVAKTDKPLAEQLDTHWRAVGLGQLAREKCRDPVSPQHLAHRGSRPGSRRQLVVFACQHRWAPLLRRSAQPSPSDGCVSAGGDHRPIRRAPQVRVTRHRVQRSQQGTTTNGSSVGLVLTSGANRGVLPAVLKPGIGSAGEGASMDERELRKLVALVKAGRVSRRAFVCRMVGLGLTVPFASQLLDHFGVARAATPGEYKPTKAGGGGALKLLFWQAPTLLNPHFAVGTKDQEGSRIFYEPLAAWDPDGNLVPVLAAEIPEIENGGVAPDGMSVIWKLKGDVQWHDGRPFTADDVVFNWEYAADPATAATTIGSYQNVTVEEIDPLTVRVRFAKPTPFWADAFVGQFGMIIPKHLFEPFKGASSRDAPANLKPVGTGPYRFVEFKPGDLVRGSRNPTYHLANRPYFDTIEMKGGGDAVSAARAVIQTGEYDYAWNLQVEDEILLRLEKSGSAKGHIEIVKGGAIEHIQLNSTDPWTEVDGEYSSAKTKHPLFSDPAVCQALKLLVDRASVEAHIYGRTGIATGNFVNNPPRFVSKNTTWEFNIDKATQPLE